MQLLFITLVDQNKHLLIRVASIIHSLLVAPLSPLVQQNRSLNVNRKLVFHPRSPLEIREIAAGAKQMALLFQRRSFSLRLKLQLSSLINVVAAC